MNINIRLLIVSLVLICVIPLIGVGVSKYSISKMETDWEEVVASWGNKYQQYIGIMTIDWSCKQQSMKEIPEMKTICAKFNIINLVAKGSWLALIVGIGLLSLIILAGIFGTAHRSTLLLTFRPLHLLTQATIIFIIVAHASILITSIYFGESALIGRVHIGIIFALGIAAFSMSTKIFFAVVDSFNPPITEILGKEAKKINYPKLWSFVEDVCKEIGTTPPTNLVLGLEPNFFVTESKVTCLDGDISGRTLFISLPFCRMLEKTELKAILAHEFGHFIGKDTKYSCYFYPIYSSVSDSVNQMERQTQQENSGSLAILPSFYIMSFFLDVFARAESKMGRDREKAADAFGAKYFGDDNFASALVKIHAYSGLWEKTEGIMIDSMRKGEQILNVSKFIYTVTSSLKESDVFHNQLGEQHTSHPTDSHPSLNERLKLLGGNSLKNLLPKMSIVTNDSASQILDQMDELEEILTRAEHSKLQTIFGVIGQINHSKSQEEIVLDYHVAIRRAMIYTMMIDGHIDEEERKTIEDLYANVTNSQFDKEDLDLDISSYDSWKEEFMNTLFELAPLLQDNANGLIIKASFLVAFADGEFHEKEKELIGKFATAIGCTNEQMDIIIDDLKKLNAA